MLFRSPDSPGRTACPPSPRSRPHRPRPPRRPVGGGFLIVPFLTAVAGLPMYLVAGTSALAVLVGMITSIFTYMVVKEVPIFWPLIGVELAGILVGSFVGPRTSKYISDIWLKRLFVLLAFYVGIRYTSKGFLGYSLLPPF